MVAVPLWQRCNLRGSGATLETPVIRVTQSGPGLLLQRRGGHVRTNLVARASRSVATQAVRSPSALRAAVAAVVPPRIGMEEMPEPDLVQVLQLTLRLAHGGAAAAPEPPAPSRPESGQHPDADSPTVDVPPATIEAFPRRPVSDTQDPAVPGPDHRKNDTDTVAPAARTGPPGGAARC